MREEELRRFPHWYIEFVKSPDEHALQSNQEMRKAFRAHFRDRFARYSGVSQLFGRLPRLVVAEATSCKDLVIESEVRDALKQFGLNKLPGLHSLPYEVYLRMSHMFVPILDGYVQPLVCPKSHSWYHYQGCDHIAEERWQACLGGLR